MEHNFRILIVAADPLARAGLSSLLESVSECRIIGLANPAELLPDISANLEESGADIIIWDWGLEVGDPLIFEFQDIDIPVITLLSDVLQSNEALLSGAKGLLMRNATPEEVIGAAAAVYQGLFVLQPELAEKFFPSRAHQMEGIDEIPTAREQQVLQLLAEGLTNKAIAQELGISQHTAKFHVNSILNKLNAQSRTEAVVQATRLGWIAL